MKNHRSSLIVSAFLLLAAGPLNAAAPDLIVSSTVNKTSRVAPGGSVRVVSTVKNIGNAVAGKSSVRFYLSKDAVKGAGDVRLTGSLKVAALGRGKAARGSVKLKVPATVAAGSYYVIAAADDRKQVKESRERNNTRRASAKVRVMAQAPAGFAYIPGGDLLMGNSTDPNDGLSSELPVHRVYVSGFFLQDTEVSKQEWDAVTIWASSQGYDIFPAGGSGKDASHPVWEVTWYEALKYCNARSEMEGLTPCYTVGGAVFRTGSASPDCDWGASGYRLPTEAEWEKAARGGSYRKRFPWGDIINHSRANFYSSRLSYELPQNQRYHPAYAFNGVPYTAPVGSFPANGYGLHDMTGNLWEWCWDCYSSSYYNVSPGADPRGPVSGGARAIRGGSWRNFARECRVSFRYFYYPGIGSNSIGFRVARSAAP